MICSEVPPTKYPPHHLKQLPLTQLTLNPAATTTSATATKPRRSAALVLLSLLVCVTGCQSQKSPTQTERTISTETSCLKQYQVSEPNRALQACNDTITATPDQPELLRDRAFIHTLNGQHQKACADIAAGLKLIRESTAPVDPMLSHELEVRQATCKQARTIAGND